MREHGKTKNETANGFGSKKSPENIRAFYYQTWKELKNI
jgi:hypothetical protein